MLAITVALAEAADAAKDYDESLGAVAWIIVAAVLVAAVVATWIVTPPRGGSPH